MPTFNIDVDEFLMECDFLEKKELLEKLIHLCERDSRLKNHMKDTITKNLEDVIVTILTEERLSYDRSEFLDSLLKLDKSYYSLSQEEIDEINRIAKRF